MRVGILWRSTRWRGASGRCALALFLTAEPLAASAADLFYCEERDSVGYHLEAAAPERVRFVGARFTLYLDRPTAAITVEGGPSWKLTCSGDDQVLSCSDGLRLFLMQRGTGQFAMSRMAGLVLAEPPAQGLTREPLTVSWGFCER